jgi:inorganic triphosphatase YgiF
MSQQIALKLAVAEGRHSALLRHPALLKASHREQHQLVSIYYDTRRLELRRKAIILRLRKKGPAWEQTVKRQETSHGGLTRRPEWHTPYLNHFDFEGVDDPDLREWLLKEKIINRLLPTFETNFRRTIWQIDANR